MTASVTRGPSIWGVIFLGYLMASALLGITTLFNFQIEFIAPRILIVAFFFGVSVNFICFIVFIFWRVNDVCKARREKGA